MADYLQRYTDIATEDVDYLLRELETISNLTQGTEEKVVYMKDSAISHQKSSPQGETLNLVPLNIVLSHIVF